MNELVSAPSREIADHIFVRLVMCPLLGSRYVDAGVCLPIQKDGMCSLYFYSLHIIIMRNHKPKKEKKAALID